MTRSLQVRDNPGSRREAGDALVEAGQTVDIGPIKGRFTSFHKAHIAFLKADDAVREAASALRKVEAGIGAADAALDEGVDEAATAASGAGLPRANPFKAFKLGSPAEIKATPQLQEPAVARKLAAALRKVKGATRQVVASANQLDKLAAAVDKAAEPLDKAKKAQQAALSRRDALALPWEKAFAALKNAARTADDDHNANLFETLFQRTVRPESPKAPKAPTAPKAPKPAPTLKAAKTVKAPKAAPSEAKDKGEAEPEPEPGSNGSSNQ